MEQIRDMIFVKQLEHRLGRPLTEQEMSGEEFEVEFADGHTEWHIVPILNFPYDLLSAPECYVSQSPDEHY